MANTQNNTMIFSADIGRSVSARGEEGYTDICGQCRSYLCPPTYEKMYFRIEDQFDWKPYYRSYRHHYVRHDVAEKLVEAKVTGLELVLIKLEIKVPQKSGERWDYYAMKPLCVVDTLFPEKDWKLDCEICGRLSQRSFGHCSRPVQMLWDSWDGSDVAHPRQFPTILLFSRRMVDFYRANNWHHDVQAVGRGRCHWDNVHFGYDKFPGVGVRNIDSDTWYRTRLPR